MKHEISKKKNGFTLIEVVVASSILVLLFLVCMEALMFYRRVARDIYWRGAADNIAYDVAWGAFNRPTSWFEAITVPTGSWNAVTTNQTSVFRSDQAMYWLSITPVGTPIQYWIIQSDVVWDRLPIGGEGRLATPLTIERYPISRNMF